MKYFKYLLSCFAIVCLFSVVASGYDSHVKVFYISGKAEVRTGDEDKWIEAQTGMVLRSGDGIKTYKESYVDIAFDRSKKNVVRINSNTHVVLKLAKEEKIELIDGEVFSTINDLPRGSSFMLRTPTAVCGARGTDWLTRGNKEKTVVEAYKDNVSIRGIDEKGRVMEGKETAFEGRKIMVERFQEPSTPERIPEKNFDRWRSFRKDLSAQGAQIGSRVTGRKTTREYKQGTQGSAGKGTLSDKDYSLQSGSIVGERSGRVEGVSKKLESVEKIAERTQGSGGGGESSGSTSLTGRRRPGLEKVIQRTNRDSTTASDSGGGGGGY